jgi:hypothetical protein
VGLTRRSFLAVPSKSDRRGAQLRKVLNNFFLQTATPAGDVWGA